MPNLQGLLGNPTFNLGIGLLGAGGRRPGLPVNLGQRFAEATDFANSRTAQFQQLQAQRNQLSAQKRQQEAFQGIQGLLSNPASNIPAAIRAPDAIQNQQQQLQGFLAQANPQGFTEALINQQMAPVATSKALQDWIRMGGGPRDRQGFMKFQGKGTSSLDHIAGLLDAQQLKELLRENAQASLQQEQDVRRRKVGASQSIAEISSLLDLFDEARGTPAEPGLFTDFIRTGSSAQAAIQNLFGGSMDAGDIAERIEKMNKSFSRLGSQLIPDTFLGSNNKLAFFANQLPSSNLQMGSNISILDSYLKAIIDEDEIDDGVLNSSEGAQLLRERIKAMTTPPPAGFIEDQK